MSVFYYQDLPVHFAQSAQEGEPFVFLHGLGGDLSQPMTSFTAPDGIRLISLDFPGHGKTPCTKNTQLTFSYFANLVASLLEHLNIPGAHIGGISMGAATSIRFALDFPAKTHKLILVRPAWLNEAMDKRIQDLFKKIAEYLMQSDGLSTFKADPAFIDIQNNYPAIYASFLSFFLFKKNPQPFELIPAQRPYTASEELQSIQNKTLIIGTKQDFLHPFQFAQTIASLIPQSTFNEITSKSVDANAHREQLQTVLLRFLQS